MIYLAKTTSETNNFSRQLFLRSAVETAEEEKAPVWVAAAYV